MDAMWLALRFPHWALDSRAEATNQQPGTSPTLVVAEQRGKRHVVAAGTAALEQGIQRGMLLADARMRLPDARVLTRHIAGEVAALERLGGWAWHYSSQVHIARASERIECARVVFEIGASLRLFGGRRCLLERVRADLDRMGYRYTLGVGDSPHAALAFARAPSQEHRKQGLARLPLACLDLDGQTTLSLKASGLRQAGELLALPPSTLVRRYGKPTLEALECLRGHRPHGLDFYTLPQRYGTRHELTGAVETTQGLVFVLRRVFAELAAFLQGADATIQTLQLKLIHDDLPPTRLLLRLAAPARDAAHLERVANERLARVTLAAPVLEIAVASDRLRRFEYDQNSLWRDTDAAGIEQWPAVLDRLRARLGHDAVGWLYALDDHRPEQASARHDRPAPAHTPTTAPRPMWLLDAPERAPADLTLIAGPERIETGWWQHSIRRDYFRARDGQGRLLWVYRDLAHAQHGDAPVYYLHGLFG
ncbi:DNA repair nucleotidyltransferase/DNA polymerase-like protein [Salinisphaera sp. T5B8]